MFPGSRLSINSHPVLLQNIITAMSNTQYNVLHTTTCQRFNKSTTNSYQHSSVITFEFQHADVTDNNNIAHTAMITIPQLFFSPKSNLANNIKQFAIQQILYRFLNLGDIPCSILVSYEKLFGNSSFIKWSTI